MQYDEPICTIRGEKRMEKKVAIILVNYNAQQYMDEFLGSIYLQDYSNIEVVLVDNASTDSSIPWLKENAPKVRLIEMQENVGFGEGCNIGMRYAIEELGAEYVLLLNIDTVIQPNLVSELQRYADDGTVTTAQIYCGEKGAALEPWYAGGEIDRNTAQANQILYPMPESEVYEVGFISGCCMMLHKKVIDKIGYFDSQFYLYYEDADYCVRMQNAGIAMKYITTTSLWHKVGGSSLGGSEASCSTQYYVTRNRLLFADKYSQMFEQGNLYILRKILEERAFFDGIDNTKHRFYVQTAIADYLRGYYEKGYYGRALLEKGYYVANGFYGKEECGDEYWYWASERCATVYLANHRKKSGVYMVSFDLAPAVVGEKQALEVVINGKDRAEYVMPGHVEFTVPIGGESIVRLDLIFQGTERTDVVDGNKRTLFYQLLNLSAIECGRDYCVLGKIYPKEQDENDFWWWSAGKDCKIYIVNRAQQRKIYVFKAAIESVDGNKYGLQIYNQGKILASIRTMEECCFPIALDSNEIYELELRCAAPIVFDYGRRVCFKLKNIILREADEELYWNECFLPEEYEGDNSWRWCTEKHGAIRLVSQSDETKLKKISYTIIPCFEKNMEEFSVFINKNCVRRGIPMDEQQLIVRTMPQTVTELVVSTEYMTSAEDDRTICFRIQNLKVEDVTENLMPDVNFYEIETNGTTRWSWCADNHGKIQIINIADFFVWRCVEFNILPFEQGTTEGVHIYQNGVDITEHCERDGHVKILVGLAPQEILELCIATEWPVAKDGERNICFCLSDIVVEDIDNDIFYGSTFGALESDGINTWSWNKGTSGNMTVINRRDTSVSCALELEIIPYGESVVSQEGIVKIGEVAEKIELGKRKKYFLGMASHECISITFNTGLPIYELCGQNYCFQVRNTSLEILQSGLYFGDEFYMEESDGKNYWRWCSEDHGKLYIVNTGNTETLKVLEFIPVVPEGQETEFEMWHGQKQLLRGVCGQKYSVQITGRTQNIEEIKILCHADKKSIGGRTLCFGIYNLRMRDVNE